jgi:hypothetical protein
MERKRNAVDRPEAREIWRLLRDQARLQRENARGMKELRLAQAQTDRQMKELGKKTGHLTNAWGEFAEDFVARAIRNIAYQKMRVQCFYGPRISVSANGSSYEVDFFAVGKYRRVDCVFIIEVKTKFHKDDIEELRNKIEEFGNFYLHYSG